MNQAVADLYVAHIALHQVHWYMRGRGFLVWHPKMDEYMESLDATLDEVSERLITLGGAPYASMVEFLEHSNIQEEKVHSNALWKKIWDMFFLSSATW